MYKGVLCFLFSLLFDLSAGLVFVLLRAPRRESVRVVHLLCAARGAKATLKCNSRSRMINDERGNFLRRISFDEVRFVNFGCKQRAVQGLN